MQLQSISNSFPNTVSITQVRQDIDVLMDLLAKYPKVKVLKGSDVLFEAQRPDSPEDIAHKKKMAAQSIKMMAKNYVVKPGEKSLTEILINERSKRYKGNGEL